jgi:uncharacterized heparinase superfamily protein
MSRASIADRGRLALLMLRRKFLHICGRWAANPLLQRPRLPGSKAERLVIAPQDLRTADPTRASEIYGGRFAFAGKIVVCDGRSPFEISPPSEEWAAILFSFGWLRHLRAAESAITRANARALVEEWMALQGSWHSLAWRPEIIARRIIAWLTQATLILDDADVRFYRRYLRSLTRQVRYLRSTAASTRDGVPRLQTRIALTYASLCMTGQIGHLRKATRKLVTELERQILPDGGHVSRNPGALIELLLDLLPLSQAFTARNVSPPPALLNAIDRMMPMLRFFRHSDGAFAMFNGMGLTSPDLIATILAYDDARGLPLSNAPHSGYQRVERGNSVLLMDTGCPPPLDLSADANAGCLSFEFSAKQQRLIVNCGLPAHGRDNWRQIARATAAHSTIVFNDTSSCEFLEGGAWRRIYGTPIVAGPHHVAVTREEQDRGGVLLHASHDGYAKRFSVIHQRTLLLSGDGFKLDGEELFLPAKDDMLPSNALDEFAVRFHLHPSIRANRLTDGHGAVLMLPNKDVWNFNAHEDRIEIEESVYLAGLDGPRRTVQIVIYGHAREVARVHWTLFHVPPGPNARRARGEEPELPL